MLDRLKAAAMRKLAIRSNVTHGPRLHVGLGSVVWAPKQLSIGSNVYIGKHATIQVDGIIGDEVLIANGVGIVGKRDHDYTQLGVTVRSANWVGTDFALSTPVRIGSDVWIGYNAIIYSGVTIGTSSIVAAGAVVTKDLPPNVIAAGAPAVVVKNRFTDKELDLHWRSLRSNGIRIL